jgi:3-hydroxymyristoyl/3-hydroxydecanoyl-(acyl carrier protein) dehydratase
VSHATVPPHSHPFRMIDVVLELDHGLCTTIKAVTSDEVVRDDPRASEGGYPFSLLLEVMAQAAIPLAETQGEDHPHAVEPSRGVGMIVGIDGARLLRPVGPGDRLLITASVIGTLGNMIRVRSVAELAGSPPGGAVVAQGEFTIALEKPA